MRFYSISGRGGDSDIPLGILSKHAGVNQRDYPPQLVTA